MAIVYNYLSLKKRFKNAVKARKLIRHIIEEEQKKLGEITIVFTDNSHILTINQSYLKHSYYTDVITFSNTLRDEIAGEIYISIDQVVINARRYQTICIEELFRVIIHGVLHLIGYNDEIEADRKLMREKEDYYLVWVRKINIAEKDELIL